MDYLEVLITDESTLRDFASSGEDCTDFPQELDTLSLPRNQRLDLWRKWVCQKISDRYGIHLSDPRIYLVDLFRQIKNVNKKLPI